MSSPIVVDRSIDSSREISDRSGKVASLLRRPYLHAQHREPAILILSLTVFLFGVENVLYEVLCRRRMNEFH